MAPPDFGFDFTQINGVRGFGDRVTVPYVAVRGAINSGEGLRTALKVAGDGKLKFYQTLGKDLEYGAFMEDLTGRPTPNDYVEVVKQPDGTYARTEEFRMMEANPQANAVRAALGSTVASNAQRDAFNGMWKMDPATRKIVPPSKDEFYRMLGKLRAQRDGPQGRIGGNLDVTDSGKKPTQRHVDGKGQGFLFDG